MAILPQNFSLLTDLYQLTMAYGYWKEKREEEEATFHLFYRKPPFGGSYALTAGLQQAVEFIQNFHLSETELSYLRGLRGNDGQPLFEEAFLTYLADLRFEGNLWAMPEGSLVFPHEPILRIEGRLPICQLLETPLLNIINFQTLIATKASRIKQAAGEQAVLEFGLRRAQGMDGGLSASRAAYIGGCSATSNVLAGQFFGIPVKGTHAHSWVMSYEDEAESFEAYARAMPNNSILLVDTYDTLEGIRKAIGVGKKLESEGYAFGGVRLDSGDLVRLSIAAREMLDAAGLPEAAVVASNDLDEFRIQALKAHGAKIDVWGVGTRLATAYDQPALGGVYKLGAIRTPGEAWRYKLKLSEQEIKISNPGRLMVKRYQVKGQWVGDVIYDEALGMNGKPEGIPAEAEAQDVLVPVLQAGEVVFPFPKLADIQARAKEALQGLPVRMKSLTAPASSPVSLAPSLAEKKSILVKEARGQRVSQPY
ncbi:MAG: nicotinate phosphoribosyltransferase [Bacteroidota bacterium]